MSGNARSTAAGFSRLRLVGLFCPMAIVLAYFLLFPFVFLLLTSFKTQAGGWSLANYGRILLEKRYLKATGVTIVLSGLVTVATMVLAGSVAFFIVRTELRWKALWRSLIAFPLSFPGIVVAFMIIVLFGNTGAVPLTVQALIGRKLFNVAYTSLGLFLAYLYFSIPRATVVLMSSVEKIDRRIEEAARTLGAGTFVTLWRVTLPAIRPALVATAGIVFATSMGAFGTAYTLSQGDVLAVAIYDEFTFAFNIQMASALAAFLSVITLSLLHLIERVFR
jgi:putative spermidine/putrescine transport system permease protein